MCSTEAQTSINRPLYCSAFTLRRKNSRTGEEGHSRNATERPQKSPMLCLLKEALHEKGATGSARGGSMRTAIPPPTPWRALGARAGGCSPSPGQLAAPCVMFSHLQWQNLAIVCHSERIPKISDCPKILVGGGGRPVFIFTQNHSQTTRVAI